MSFRPQIGRLVVISDTTIQWRFNHEQLAELACAGGANVIQLRDKVLPNDEFARVGERVLAICRAHNAQLIINDRVHVAKSVGADGVHVGRGDMTVQDARVVMGSLAVVGTSAANADEAQLAHRAGADYVGVGHVFMTTSKHKEGSPIGLETLADACRNTSRPVIAIGGINAENAAGVMQAGAHGIAVISAVCAADDPRAATARLREIVDANA
ncbi:MAG TPA: thiamine phosphate synthase [Candidatus Krumholzibacteria bacterium]|nr:thiamine phosphate synthase [Candidatus Krumholzibacteria bacterium]